MLVLLLGDELRLDSEFLLQVFNKQRKASNLIISLCDALDSAISDRLSVDFSFPVFLARPESRVD